MTQLGVAVSTAGDGPNPSCMAFLTQSWEHRLVRIVLPNPLEVKSELEYLGVGLVSVVEQKEWCALLVRATAIY